MSTFLQDYTPETTGIERQRISISAGGRDFTFEVYSRPLKVAEGLEINYFWIDVRDFRPGLASGAWRKMVDFYWALVGEQNLSPEELQGEEETRIMAELYPVARPRLAQFVFDDGRLKVVEHSYDPDFLESIRAVKEFGGVTLERYQMALLALGNDIPIHPFTQEVYEGLIPAGQAALDAGGGKYFDILREKVNDRLSKEVKRKLRPGNEIDQKVRDFIAHFSFEIEQAFFCCYSQAWSFIIGQIATDPDVSMESINFLKKWHFQQKNFASHVPALHPISGVIMMEPMLLGMLEPCLRDPESDEGGRMLTAVMALAMERFKNLKDEQEMKRGVSVSFNDPSNLDNIILADEGNRIKNKPPKDWN